MRLLDTSTLRFEEFYDSQIPDYAILSHRWGSLDEEVSYTEYLGGWKKNTIGYSKTLAFCHLARSSGLSYGWVDTCCIDKTSSAELSEAINSMYYWYQNAKVCYAYIQDVHSVDDLARSEWFQRGWTLQELVAPSKVLFFNAYWQLLGSRYDLRHVISRPSGVDVALLAGDKGLGEYSIAQIMSWASHRRTSRVEDEAYCLLGLFGVSMPLLYGERREAFRRLQEGIMARSDDNSLFAWDLHHTSSGPLKTSASLLASSPLHFAHSHHVHKGFATQRILFEPTNRGMMVLIHQSYNPRVLETLLNLASEYLDREIRLAIGLTLPLGCYVDRYENEPRARQIRRVPTESFFLRLVLESGKWRRMGVTSRMDEDSWAEYTGKHFFAYTNDYVRIYVHHDREHARGGSAGCTDVVHPPPIRWLHVQDDTDYRYRRTQEDGELEWCAVHDRLLGVDNG